MGNPYISTEHIWSHLCELRPQLRQHVRVHVQVYRGEKWFLLQDELSSDHLRLNARAHAVVGRLDGKRSLKTIYKYLVENEFADISVVEIVDIIGRLQHLGAISNVLDKSTLELFKQYRDTRKNVQLNKLISPLFIRIPIFNPDKLLEKITPYTKYLAGTFGVLLWLLVVLPAIILSLQHWDDLAAAYSSDILKPANLVLLWLLYPVMKLLHEFAHGICVKYWGGDVHEMGITLLVFTPVPYVDASAATVFKSKQKRMVVSAAGIMVELFLASIALYVWLAASDGLLRDCALGVFTIGAVSTVLFNANPLLKFDGTARGERRWFLIFGAASLIYRILVLCFIVVFLSSKYLLLGVALGCWALTQQLVFPLIRSIKYLLLSAETACYRQRSSRLVWSSALVCVVVIGIIPMPSSTAL